MTLCSVCLHSIPANIEQCPFCHSDIDREQLLEIDEDEDISWAIARTVSTEIEATLMAGRLRAYGIPAFVLSQVDTTRNFTIGLLAVAKVFVPESMLERAQEILASPPEEPDDDGSGNGSASYNNPPIN